MAGNLLQTIVSQMKYFFLLGCHRSGTTLLQQALNRHSQIAIPPETKFFSWFLGHCRRCQLRRLERLNRDLQISLPAPARPIRGKAAARQFFAELAVTYVARLSKPSVVCFGEKTPAHSGYVPRIRDTFPEAKLIWLYRDGRDVALSMRKVPWMNRHLGVNMLIWLYYYRHQRRLAHDTAAPALFVKYEDLVARPEIELKRVTDFLGLPYEPQVALGSGNTEGVLEWEYPWKGRALEPISSAYVGTWRTELLPAEIELVEAIGGGALRELGYPLVNERPTAWRAWLAPRLMLEAFRFFRVVRWDEAANQLFGRALCFG